MSFLVNSFRFGGATAAWEYDPSDLSTVWQDSIGGTPAAATDPVGVLEDKSGNGHHLEVQSSPTLQQDGSSNYYVLLDGVDDILRSASGVAVPCATVIIAARIISTSLDANAGLLTNRIDQAAGVDYAFVRSSTSANWGYFSQVAGSSLSDSSHIWRNQVNTAAMGTDTTWVFSMDGTNHPATLEFPTGIQFGNDRSIAGRFCPMRLYYAVGFDTILSTAERNAQETIAAGKAGVTF